MSRVSSVWPEKVLFLCVTVRGAPEDRPKIASEGHFRPILAVSVREATFLPDLGAAATTTACQTTRIAAAWGVQRPVGYAAERALNAASLLASSWAINSLPRT